MSSKIKHPELIHLRNMKNFYIQIPENISIERIEGLLITLDTVSLLFKYYFEFDEKDIYLTIILSYDQDA